MTETLAERWGTAVADRRAELGFNQTQLADLCDVKQQTISKIEAGKMIPHDRLKADLANALMMEPADLFSWPSRADMGPAA